MTRWSARDTRLPFPAYIAWCYVASHGLKKGWFSSGNVPIYQSTVVLNVKRVAVSLMFLSGPRQCNASQSGGVWPQKPPHPAWIGLNRTELFTEYNLWSFSTLISFSSFLVNISCLFSARRVIKFNLCLCVHCRKHHASLVITRDNALFRSLLLKKSYSNKNWSMRYILPQSLLTIINCL